MKENHNTTSNSINAFTPPVDSIHDELSFSNSLKQTPIFIHFSDGTSFSGFINQKDFDKEIWGESAFTTGMSGYQETATDPSFLGQHIIYTTAHVGNYEYDERVNQSQSCHGTCLIARHFSYNKFLEKINVPLISGIDTRALTLYLSGKSKNHISVITANPQAPKSSEFTTDKVQCSDISRVGQDRAQVITKGDNPIVLINYGVKQAIIDNIKAMGHPLVTLSHTTTIEEIQSYNPRLVFLSNGPGDPREYTEQISVVKDLLKTKIPVRGICLGHQLLGLAMDMEIIKLPFGQRGANHPVYDHKTKDLLITSQNHGYAICSDSFSQKAADNHVFIEYTSLFDRSLEGMRSYDSRIRSVQFHPEANPGPLDGQIFFTEIKDYLDGVRREISKEEISQIPEYHSGHLNDEIKKILLIGSGPIKIGQASEFDYSGTQALKSLKELGIEVVLLNSNPATIMTDKDMSYKTYIEPITKDVIKKIIEKEKVDAVLSTMGGQTALNMCIELEEESYLAQNGVKLLGANVDTIKKTEDRELFAQELKTLGYKSGKRFKAFSHDEAITLAKTQVEYPLIIRRDFALGGKGAALVHNTDELKDVLNTSDIKYPITMEKSLLGWKEVELEVMVDKNRNGVVICSIENVDPCGIHTGDSITVAPAQTISDRCYQQLRTMSLTIAKHMNVVAGGANVQFAINPADEDDIVVIEMNPRVSRSSALASKATGYPIAKISAGLALGLTLFEIMNDITKVSPVAFEPTLDYVAVKIPIFPFNKFPSSSQTLGPQMRSVGEVLALGGSFNEAFMKALRATEQGLEIPALTQLKTTPFSIDNEYIKQRLNSPRELCLLTTLVALRQGFSVKEITEMTKITPWFVEQMNKFYHMEKALHHSPKILEDAKILHDYKAEGFSDKYLALLTNSGLESILDLRVKNDIFPVFKAVDTCSGEFSATTPYFYSTYNKVQEVERLENAVAIFGSGPNRIGQGIEFDYSCVKACQLLATENKKSIMLNSNPETVSTDYDSSDRLYLSPLFSEDLFDILRFESPEGVITSFSGQTGINIRSHLEADFRKKYNEFNFLGPNLDILDLVEDRKRFDELTKKVPLSRTTSKEIRGHKQLISTITEIGLPVIIRPSYVIGGESMYIFRNHEDIHELPGPIKEGLKNSSVVFQVENYIENALEFDVDLVRDHRGNTIFTVCEHIEHAGVHSGDSGMVSPPVHTSKEIINKMREIAKSLSNEMGIIGPINFQFAVKGEDVYCIEANPRGSRTLPFLSKAADINLPAQATKALLGQEIQTIEDLKTEHFVVKQSTFPFDRFVDDSIILGPKMRSTGETLGIDKNLKMAMFKSYLGNYPGITKRGKILISLADKSKEILKEYLGGLHELGFEFVATKGSCRYIIEQGYKCQLVNKIADEKDGASMLDAIKDEDLVMVLNTPLNMGRSKSDGEYIRNVAIQYGVPCFTREENVQAIVESILSYHTQKMAPVALQEMH
ncbi:carbamoyl-phosphate synthase large subunit [Bacteriovorax sp. DB6_IX]|uniref:carbamoyl-phosphate synthase large subunit n=1 Tax=Bacteriovorax sp. DB6_IX TaxID=1353530 RepID=UPI00038A0EAB|nr:carbamoyl-phosphate synthase large subunit [Bacteriovorax sp. DB6_IX]EQC50971.1 carbamoyl-phosphate synthase, large subunit [Bacteriovorax sp. DB6_IX]